MGLIKKSVSKLLQFIQSKKWRRVVTCMAAVVVFCTVYALILPAVTMDSEEAQSDSAFTAMETEKEESKTEPEENMVEVEQEEPEKAPEEPKEEPPAEEPAPSEEPEEADANAQPSTESQSDAPQAAGEAEVSETTGVPETSEASEPAASEAKTYTASADGYAVEVDVPAGAFHEEVTLKVEPFEKEKLSAAAKNLLQNEDLYENDAVFLDIGFYNGAGTEVEPDSTVSVTITAPESQLPEGTLDVYHIVNENGERSLDKVGTIRKSGAKTASARKRAKAKVGFRTDSFSVYAIIGTGVTDPRYTVEFYTGNGMTGDPYETQLVKSGDTLVRPETPVIPEGYNEFLGWYLGGSEGTDGTWTGGTEVQFGVVSEDWLTTNANGNSVIQVHARFTNAIHVTFYDCLPNTKTDENGNYVNPAIVTTRSMTDGPIDLNSVTAEPWQNGMVFDKWVDENDNSVSTPYTVTEDTSLYATFVKGYSLVFNANGDGASSTATQYLKENEVTSTPATPARPGYTFQGWYTAANGGSQFTFGNVLTQDTTVYAHWTAATANYTVVFWYENADDDDYSYAGSITDSASTGSTISSSSFWNTNFTGRDSTHFTYNSSKAESQDVAGDGSTVLNVYFTRNTYTLTFKSQNQGGPNGGSQTTYGTITAKYQAYIGGQWPTAGTTMAGSSTRVPDNLIGWRVSSTMTQATKVYTMTDEYCSNSGMTLTAVTNSNTATYTINYMMESLDGTGSYYNGTYYQNDSRYTQTMTYSKNTTTWNAKQIDGFTAVTSTAKVNNNTFNLYYKRNRNNITFNDSYGNTTATISDVMFEMPLSRVTYDGKAISEIVPTYPNAALAEHYTFKGWYTTEGCFDGTEADFTTGIMPNANLIFYAKWEAEKIDVTYDANGGTFTDAGTTADKVQVTVDYGTQLTNAPSPYNEGYTFLGWVDEEGNPWNFETAVTENMTLYAQWHTDHMLNVVYNVNGNETQVTDLNQYNDGSTAIVKPYDTEGTRFVGWRLGNGIDYTDLYQPGDEIEVSSTTDRADGKSDYTITLYAVFADEITTSITFDPNGGLFGEDVDTDTNGNYVLSLANNKGVDLDKIENPVQDGYKFIGWSTSANGEVDFKADGTEAEEIAVDNLGDTPNILYAVWQKLVQVNIQKVDAETNAPLSGAVFTLQKGSGNVNIDIKTNEDGTASLGSLEAGTYTLTETTAPDGYIILANGTTFTIDENGTVTMNDETLKAEDGIYTITIENTAGEALPSTGGAGTWFYTLSGMTLTAAALLYGCVMRRKRERGNN